ncbi:RimK family alpha-L-glutamate ligase [Haloferax mediterranei ATCC 33500]|uniref:Alpha-L-glutamate ligase n=1 Tax=Haloferax mediterranei (strain ATCC 33500 / DSM 1411 / JCM 8866 / NBRC 14739 / NCIMB 2177 / R-4) TaxID=523841 RepID=I3R1S4_HALMT|nr:RimK family alpha-L-glutamate ligase [Haloferax mediterranei]AFK18184.2 ribosomal protein S6 modification protein [Haloferax mediterranei ATCC 33500]AHZ22408.1 alpha-L-glutamate ligase [Haloferax mediterranei ATCC 33500]EMA02542.1 ribosomal protein S6 modification protein [Haloferax mediterranei ATCC 33500]MDX5988275.1 RimK family alpha-L-glutamate ligase [Haloferax mediterranei ATCC 33500]QCQ74713.1 RimK family alpha-L-glutamate ligase [Haloferax mediterranei ATCC 33500]
MLRLAVTTSSETFERMRDPLAERGIEVGHLRAKRFALDLSTPPTESFDVGFVYPTREMEGGVVTARHDIPWVNTREDILTSRNKAGVIAALKQSDIPVPKSVYVSNPADESELVETIEAAGLDFPVVLKPNSTTRGAGIAKAHDPDSLSGLVDHLNLVHDYRATGDKSYLVQEWLPNASDYRVMVLDGQVVGAVERRLSDSARADGRWKHNVHRGAEAVGVDLPKRHRALAEVVAAELDIRYLGVDLLESDGRVVVSETNARPTIDDGAKYDDGFFDRLAALIERVAKKS